MSKAAPLVLDATRISEYQACQRKLLLSHDWRVVRWRPKTLFDACLRRGILAMAAGTSAEQTAADVSAFFMQTAANPGLDLTATDPFTLAKDYCAMLDTVLRALARRPLMVLHERPPETLSSALQWRFLAHADDSGTLHRWITADGWRQADLARELHSWWVMGDISVAEVPMVLHVVEIGRLSKGRRASPWARGWKHPAMPSLRMRFVKQDGAALTNWKPHYLADDRDADPDAWVEQMEHEGVTGMLIHHVPVNCPPADVCLQTRAQIMLEARRIDELITERVSSPYSALPMSRNACDGGLVPCPFQDACYTTTPIDLATLGLYQTRT